MSFLNLVHFDGRLKRDKNQEAMINSLNERDRFLQKLESDRAARAEDVKQKLAASKIQKFFKRYQTRLLFTDKIRHEFDSLVSSTVPQILATQATRLNVFYQFHTPGDNGRLITLCGNLLKAAEEVGPTFLRDNTRLHICRKIFRYIKLEDKKNFSRLPVGCLRFMEWFCTDEDYEYLSKHGWYEGVIRLIQGSIPADGFIGVQDYLPPRVDALCQLLIKPSLDKVIREDSVALMLTTIFNHQDVSLMFQAILPYICRHLTAQSFHPTLAAANKVQISTKNGDLLRLHFYILLFSPEKNLDLADSLKVFHEFANNLPAWIINDKTVLEKGEIQKSIHNAIHSKHFADFFPEAVKATSTDNDMKAITRFSSIAPFSLINVLTSAALFMERLYSYVTNMKSVQVSLFSNKSTVEPYVRMLALGYSLDDQQRAEFLPSLTLLSSLISSFVDSTFDEDFALGGRVQNALPTVISATRLLRDLALGLIDLAFPDNMKQSMNKPVEQRKAEETAWSGIYEQLIGTLQTVHRKDSRVSFLPDGFWTDHGREVMVNRNSVLPRRTSARRNVAFAPFSFIRYLAEEDARNASDSDTDEEMDEKAKPSTMDLRNLSIIRSVPFLLFFDKRLKIFQDLIDYVRGQYNEEDLDWGGRRGSAINVTVRRQYLYDDSFESLSQENAPNLLLPIRVRMINWAGANEHGVDGGGIFREFLSELLKAGLDPERGLFCYTHDRLLYPNPITTSLYADTYHKHYFFLGRMLAKLIYEGMLLDARFADFFLVQLLGYRVTNIDLEQMKSYDPNVYKHLRDLLEYSEVELAELGLDFSVIVDTLGVVENVELKSGGRDIPVTKYNIREYVQLYVNYHLKQRISPMVKWMREGVSNVIEPTWLGMFDPAELQVIVSGTDADINIDDMKNNTIVYPCEGVDHKSYMDLFWKVAREMTAENKAALLKFITGCPRPPISGFRNLAPNIAVQLNTHSDMLPMSATCMNLLKLPVYTSKSTLEKKLNLAINSNSGFELA